MARKKKNIGSIKPKANLRKNIKMSEMQAVRQMFNERLNSDKTSDFKLPDGATEINELLPDEALSRIDEIVKQLLYNIAQNGEPNFNVPSRTSSNIIYDEIQDIILLGNKTILL